MKTIRDFLLESMADGAFPGACWQIGTVNDILEQGSVGTLGEGLENVTADSLYDLASVTKIIVTCALMRQFQEGLFRLDDPIGLYLPAYADHPKGSITIKELLTHTSVIPGQLQLYRHAHTRKDLLEAIRWQLPRADSPDRVAYTSKGYIVLGEVVAAIDHSTLDEVVRRRVLEPLQMTDTCWNPPEALLPRIAATEFCPWRGKIVRGQVHDENAVVMEGVAGHAGLFSTARDVSRIAAAMLGANIPGTEEPFFHPATIALMTRNYTPGRGEHRGLGFILVGPNAPAGDLMSPTSFGHTGFTGTSIWVDPEKGLYAVLLSNRIHPNRDNPKIFRVRHIFHNLAVLTYT
ncbi:MAG: beta-lactamase family protein [Clostridia bacterium]|nr:beta-lactamase family protein [Clostridia bacterium]